ncbi:MAG: cobalt-precorrin 5A hydrolase [Methanomicrobiaceae archaeon]|nr:cobalt-precorrin 5A hydrolase [Methanomicrobiaceae archaeon]
MKDTVVISLERFAPDAKKLAAGLNADFELYSKEVFADVFCNYQRVIAVMSAGIAVRSAARHLKDKWTDPCLVVVSPDFRYSIPVTGGHHGGNDLARDLEKFGILPVITTATETKWLPSVEGIAKERDLEIINKDSTRAVNSSILDGEVAVHIIESPAIAIVPPGVSVMLKRGEYIVGIGCRKGISKEDVLTALDSAFAEAGIQKKDVLAYATAELKKNEKGLREAIDELNGNLIFPDDDMIKEQIPLSPSRALDKLGLPGVAEPAALALSKKKDIIMEKRKYGGVTIAIIR